MNTRHLFEDSFDSRHIGPSIAEEKTMLALLNVPSIDELIDETVPAGIRLKTPLQLPEGIGEHTFLAALQSIASKNKVYTSYIGLGYYNCYTPSVIQRNILENPGWYTQYTPYQAEIAQGRLEALLNFQTMIVDLTGMDVANASLLDEGTAAAEAMIMLYGILHRSASRAHSNKFFVSKTCLPHTIDVLQTRAEPLGFELVIGDHTTAVLDDSYFGAILQYPSHDGAILDYREWITMAHEKGVRITVAADLMALVHLVPPGEFGADVVVGNTQRFGVPLGYGGPHAAYFAAKNEYLRMIPGRIIGVSIDARSETAYRMTLQTREQHIRREKATSNICTAQALLAIMAGMYAVYHGAQGLRRIAGNIHLSARALSRELQKLGYVQHNELYFDTLKVHVENVGEIQRISDKHQVNFRIIDTHHVGISLDETTTVDDIIRIAGIFGEAKGTLYQAPSDMFEGLDSIYPAWLNRASAILTHPIFNASRSETEILRYIKRLENRDLSLTHSMTPLGSCTMKLNATTELLPVTWKEFSALHPFVPAYQAEGYHQMFRELETQLCTITGFYAASLQPNSGAQGEYTGLMVIRRYHRERGDMHRNVALIPSSAHGTNPASAVMAGLKVVIVACDDNGNIDLDDLRTKAEAHAKDLCALIVTYPSTHGVFEESIVDVCSIIHQHGGQVYMDGANLNAQVGLTSPGLIGADVCHINLHKTFSIPHGGGGPGMGPICVAKHLAPFLPGHKLAQVGGEKAISAVAAAPWGSAGILMISYAYIRMLGARGCTNATKFAILNANYLKTVLEQHYRILYQGKNGRVAHEFIIDLRPFKDVHIEAEDVAKRLMDYGFHAPTVSFPVAGTLMIEPTESESKAELDRFAKALISIRDEIQAVADGKTDPTDNVLHNAPHTASDMVADSWTHPYSRQQALFPLPYVKANKFWPAVSRINNSYGDRNVVCTCPPSEEYKSHDV